MKLRNNTLALTLIFAAVLLLPIASNAANAPCSGSKGGIASCDGAKFVCIDGSVSKSVKDCFSYLNEDQKQSKPDTSSVPLKSAPVAQSNTEITRSGNILKLNYPGFTVWLDCSKRGAIKFLYVAQRDSGNAKRYDKFFLDQNVPAECQQQTANAYGQGYDRGHQVPANHLDASDAAIKATNTMTNILPQAANMNRGAWLQTEEIIVSLLAAI